MSSSLSPIARKGSVLFVIKVAGSGLALGSQILLARALGPESYGYYAYSLACASLVLLLTTMGLDRGALRYVASYLIREEPGLLRAYLAFAHRRALLASVLLGSVGAGLLLLFRYELGYDFAATALIACMLLPTRALAEISGAGLQGLRRVVRARLVLDVVRPLALIAGVTLAHVYAEDSLSASSAMLINVMGHLLAAGLLAVALATNMPQRVPGAAKSQSTREWSRVSWHLALIGGLHLVVVQTDVLMLGALSGTTEAGIYGAAGKVASLAVFGLMVANTLIAPMISELFTQKKIAELQSLVTLTVRASVGITLLLTVGILLLRIPILRTFGLDFVRAETALLILLVGQLINALCGPAGLLMTMTAHQSTAAKVIGLSALMNVILNAVFIPRWGLEGAALATAISTSTWNLALAGLSRKELGVKSSFL